MKQTSRPLLLGTLSAFFVVAGCLHFFKAKSYAAVVPPQFGMPLLWVYLSGFCEISGGLAILWVPLRKIAGGGLIALLVAVYPANIYMATHGALFRDIAPAEVLWLRLPLQIVFVAWVWWCCFHS